MRQKVATTNAGCADPQSAQPQLLDTLLDQRRQFLRFLERRVSSPAIAEDILQNAYLRAVEREGELRNGESGTAWFYRILRNAVIDFYRHRGVEDRALTQWAAELETTVEPDDLTRDIVCKCIARVLPSLNPGYARILRQVDLDEASLDTYAKANAITVPNATVRIHRARQALKKALIATCGSCSAHGCLNCNCRA
jgi:RNA polymerase sigma factor (sigma-70 family)